jgi:hypothetical protein
MPIGTAEHLRLKDGWCSRSEYYSLKVASLEERTGVVARDRVPELGLSGRWVMAIESEKWQLSGHKTGRLVRSKISVASGVGGCLFRE